MRAVESLRSPPPVYIPALLAGKLAHGSLARTAGQGFPELVREGAAQLVEETAVVSVEIFASEGSSRAGCVIGVAGKWVRVLHFGNIFETADGLPSIGIFQLGIFKLNT